jgi:hypothetical protein
MTSTRTISAPELFGIDPAAPPPLPPDTARLGVTVLIPTHRPPRGDRTATFETCLATLAVDVTSGDLPVAVIVIADGLDAGGLDRVARALERTGLPSLLVPTGRTGTPTATGWLGTDPADRLAGVAGARNVGLAALAGLPPDSPLRHRYLLHLDDDSVLAPGGLAAMVRVLEERPSAVGVSPQVVGVPELGAWLSDAPVVPAGPVRTHVLPGALHAGRYDLLGLAFSGDLIVGRGVGQLVRTSTADAVLGTGRPVYFEGFPAGSTEDMLANAALCRMGELLFAPDVQVGDQVRGDPTSTRIQQRNWGYDHAWLAGALSAADAVEPGIHVLSHEPGGWVQRTVPSAEHVGFVVNPGELGVLSDVLSALVRDRETARTLFLADHDQLVQGAATMTRVLRELPGLTAHGRVRPRPDLPPPLPRTYTTMRAGLDGLLSHLAGNALGSLIGGHTGDGLPRHFLYGLHQETALGARVRRSPGDVP